MDDSKRDLRVSTAELKAIEGVLEEERARTAEVLKSVIDEARAGKPAAVKRLKLFGSYSPELATKLIGMNRAQRRAYLAERKRAAGRIRAKRKGGAK